MEENKPKQGSSLPSNLHIVWCNRERILSALEEIGIGSGHLTSGAYIAPADEIVPRVLAGFARAIRDEEVSGTPLAVAVHSDESLYQITGTRFESRYERTKKVGVPLAKQYPDRAIVMLTFDEKTSTDLCLLLGKSGFKIESYHKAESKLESAPVRNNRQPAPQALHLVHA